MIVSPAYAQAEGGGAALFTNMIPLVLIIVIMYFLMIRPQQKRAREHREMVAQLKRGDEVITQGGVVGKITKVKDDTEVEVEISKDVRVRVMRGTITQVLNKTEPVSPGKSGKSGKAGKAVAAPGKKAARGSKAKRSGD